MDEFRARILAAFGLTEEDMAAMEQMDGYAAAYSQARVERAAFVADIERRVAEAEAKLQRDLALDETLRVSHRARPGIRR